MFPDLSELAGLWIPSGRVHTPVGSGWEKVATANPNRWIIAFASRDASWFLTTSPDGDFDGPDLICPFGGQVHFDYQKWGNITQLDWYAYNITGGVKLSVWENIQIYRG